MIEKEFLSTYPAENQNELALSFLLFKYLISNRRIAQFLKIFKE